LLMLRHSRYDTILVTFDRIETISVLTFAI
jgi:hypothetical protein